MLYGKRAGLLSCRDKPIWPFGEVRREKRLVFLHCVFKCTLNRLPEWMQSRTRYICLIFLPCLFSNDVSNCLHLLSITTHVALFHVETASLLNVLLWYSMCSLKTLSDIIYLPHKFQIKCVETIFLLNVALCFFQMCLQIHSKRGCKVTLVALVWYVVQHFLFYGDKDKHVILQNWTSFHIFHKIPPQAGICSFGCTFGVRMPAKPQENPKTMPDALSRSRFWEIHIQKNMQDHARSCENVI